MKGLVIGVLVLYTCVTIGSCAGPPFAPYYDTFLDGRTNQLTDIFRKTGQKSFHLAFVLGGGCVPMWGAKYNLDDPIVLNEIKAIQKEGGEMIVATGGALGPYLENSCQTSEELTAAYKKILDTVGTDHLDVDVESNINFSLMNTALARLQAERPSTTVSFTLMVQSDDWGLNPALGTDLLKHAKANGVRVDIVNAMLMEFWTAGNDWGQAVISASEMILKQMKEIWPEKSDAEIRKMYGGTPMIGRNFSGKIFTQDHARRLVEWANQNKIGLLAFWSAERDNGKCPGGGVSPLCSGVQQEEFEFTKIFQGFHG